MASLPHSFEEPGDAQGICLVVDTILTLAWSAAPDGSAEFHNQRLLDSTGLSPKQVLGSGWQVAISQTTCHEFWKHIETLTLEAPRRDEVPVRVVATGLCHTDMVGRDQGYPVPHPIVLGHEGAGIVESVGADALKVVPGDSVVLTFLTCGRCKPCRVGRMAHCEKTFPLCFGGARLGGRTATLDGHGDKVHDHFFGQSSFATYALANERNVVKVSSDVPLERLCPLGCGIQTGAGAVMNALNVRPGTSFASFGAGARGSATMAARAVGATTSSP